MTIETAAAKLGARAIGLIVGGALLLALAIGGTLLVQHWLSAGKQAKVDGGQARATGDAGVVALQVQGEIAAQRSQVDINVRGKIDAIQSAPAGDSNDAADRALCGMRSYRETGRCTALLGAGAGEWPAD